MTNNTICIYCNKGCNNSDSRPFPNSKGKDRIHNKCQIKKNLSDRNSKKTNSNSIDIKQTTSLNDEQNKPTVSMSVLERITKEDDDLKKIESERKLTKLVESQSKKSSTLQPNQSLFFDLKAGIAKPHEKRRYLHHKKLSEVATRYNDDGFREEAIGKAYDHTGKDLNTLSDNSDCDDDKESDTKKDKLRDIGKKRKRKFNSIDDDEKLAKRKSKIKIDQQNPCWFCLSSPKIDRDLIKSIGEFCYISLAKGGLTDDHFLILPINHIESLNDKEANSKELLEELEEFKTSLIDFFRSEGKAVVFFERNFKSVHWQLQVVPVPFELIDTIEGDIKILSNRHFKNSDYIDIPSEGLISDFIPSGAPYLYWQIEPIGVKFVTKIEVKGSFFPIQLGRLILSDRMILNCPDRVNWRDCVTKEK